MTFNYSKPEIVIFDPPGPDSATPPAPATPDLAPASTPQTDQSGLSAAVIRFRSCRWSQPPENGMGEFCTHREVKPYAGTAGFDASAWCPECKHYKLRRSPKKRQSDEYSY